MSKRLFVGNLTYQTQEHELEEAFAPYGVTDVHLPLDRLTGRPRGFAFVTVEDDQVEAAIAAWNGTELQGRPLTVNEARPREEGGGRSRFSGGDRGGYGGGSGGGYGGGDSFGDSGGWAGERSDRGGRGRGDRGERGDRRNRW